jgi:hypothetical protein
VRICCAALYLAVLLPVLAAVPLTLGDGSGTEPRDAGWSKVERLRSGQTIRVHCSGNRTWTGRVAERSAGEVVLDAGGSRRKIARSEVLRIEVKSRAESALIGLGIGVGVGVGVGYAAGSGLKGSEKTTAAGLGAVLFAPAGAGIGALCPRWKVVYRGDSSAAPSANTLPAK